MTLAVLSIDIEAVDPTHTGLLEAIPRMASELRHYIISFTILATFWVGQHYLIDRIKRTDAGLNWIVMIHLLLIALIPATTDVIGDFDSVLAVQIFVVNIFLISLSVSLEQTYICNREDLGTHSDLKNEKPLGRIVLPGMSVIIFFLAYPLDSWATSFYLLSPFVKKVFR